MNYINDFTAYKKLLVVRSPSAAIFQIFNLYRLLLSGSILAIYDLHEHQSIFGNLMTELFWSFALIYFLSSAVLLTVFALYQPSNFSLIISIFLLIIADLIILVCLSYFSSTQQTILSSLMLVPIAFGAVLIAGRLSTFLPAFAFLCLSYIELKAWVNHVNIGFDGFYQLGILGIEFFVVSYLFQFYSKNLLYKDNKLSVLERLKKAEELAANARNELNYTNKKLEALLKSAGEGVLGVDANGTIDFANPYAAELLETDVKRLIGAKLESLFIVKDGEQQKTSEKQHRNFMKMNEALSINMDESSIAENQWQTLKGHKFYVEYSCENLKEEDGLVIVFQNISSRKENEDLLNHLANYDALTDIPNRQFFLHALSKIQGISKRSNEKLAVFFLDLDHFKFINDTLGHAIGDQLLMTVAERIQHIIRSSDIVARIGGDEFAILLSNLDHEKNASDIAEKILDKLAEPIVLEGHTFTTSASIGIAVYPGDAISPEALLKKADTAMYEAKQEGRGNYQFFRKEMQQNSDDKHRLQMLLHTAIEQEEFHLNFQPIIDLKNKHIVSLEVLIRWVSSDGENIPPDIFIPLAEKSGKIKEIGLWVLEKSVEQLVAWKEMMPYVPAIAINVSSRQLDSSEFRLRISDLLEKYSLSPEALEIELTETGVMDNADVCLKELTLLQDMGIKVAIDDFGTGYSSLDYLRRLPLDILKIDQCFTKGIGHSKNDEELIRLMLTMADSLNLKVIAEGVETQEQLDFLKNNECEMIQGYYFSKPCSAEKIIHFFHDLPNDVLNTNGINNGTVHYIR
jgi:diguanylate cyclase (GGDEF)-like protein